MLLQLLQLLSPGVAAVSGCPCPIGGNEDVGPDPLAPTVASEDACAVEFAVLVTEPMRKLLTPLVIVAILLDDGGPVPLVVAVVTPPPLEFLL